MHNRDRKPPLPVSCREAVEKRECEDPGFSSWPSRRVVTEQMNEKSQRACSRSSRLQHVREVDPTVSSKIHLNNFDRNNSIDISSSRREWYTSRHWRSRLFRRHEDAQELLRSRAAYENLEFHLKYHLRQDINKLYRELCFLQWLSYERHLLVEEELRAEREACAIAAELLLNGQDNRRSNDMRTNRHKRLVELLSWTRRDPRPPLEASSSSAAATATATATALILRHPPQGRLQSSRSSQAGRVLRVSSRTGDANGNQVGEKRRRCCSASQKEAVAFLNGSYGGDARHSPAGRDPSSKSQEPELYPAQNLLSHHSYGEGATLSNNCHSRGRQSMPNLLPFLRHESLSASLASSSNARKGGLRGGHPRGRSASAREASGQIVALLTMVSRACRDTVEKERSSSEKGGELNASTLERLKYLYDSSNFADFGFFSSPADCHHRGDNDDDDDDVAEACHVAVRKRRSTPFPRYQTNPPSISCSVDGIPSHQEKNRHHRHYHHRCRFHLSRMSQPILSVASSQPPPPRPSLSSLNFHHSSSTQKLSNIPSFMHNSLNTTAARFSVGSFQQDRSKQNRSPAFPSPQSPLLLLSSSRSPPSVDEIAMASSPAEKVAQLPADAHHPRSSRFDQKLNTEISRCDRFNFLKALLELQWTF